MKNILKVIFISALLTSTTVAFAQLPVSGIWTNTTVSADETVYLEGNVDLQGTITVSAGATLTVKLAESVSTAIDIKRSTSAVMFKVNGTLEIVGSSDDKCIVIDGNYNSSNAGYGIYGNNSTSTILLNYTILQDFYRFETSSDAAGSAVYMGTSCNESSSFTMKNSKVQNCIFGGTKYGGIMFFSSAQSSNTKTYKVTFQNDLFDNNEVTSTSQYSGGVIFGHNDKSIDLQISNCTFTNNTSAQRGGAINWRSKYPGVTISESIFKENEAGLGGAIALINAGATVTDCEFISNKASTTNGGAIYSDYPLTLSGGIFDGNIATNNGGAIYNTRDITVNGTTFTLNKAVNGGAIYTNTNNGTSVLIQGETIFRENTATTDGGAVCFIGANGSTSSVTLNESTLLTKNIAGANGGALAIYRNAASDNTKFNVTLDGITMSYNEATGAGGGLYCGGTKNYTTLTVNSSTFDYNKSLNSSGGGISIERYIETADITNSDFSYNEATGNGGAYSTCNIKTLNITGTDFNHNESSANGGAAYFASSATTNVSGGAMTDNSAVNGGAIAVSSTGACTFNILGDCNIESNTATGDGGAVYFEKNNASNANLVINACTIKSNDAVNGGAISAYKTNTSNSLTLTFNAGTIKSNNASANGGGLYMSAGTLKFSGDATVHSVIDGNTAVDGAGAYLTSAVAGTYNYGEMSNNIATGNGGGLYISGGTQTFTQSTSSVNYNYVVNGNSAVDGGGIYLSAATAVLNSGEVYGNTAGHNGGGIYADGGKITFTGLSKTEYFMAKANKALNGAGMYLTNGTAATVSKWAEFSGNHAIANAQISTAYQSTPAIGETIQGIGGGIYVATGTSTASTKLTFSNTTEFGVHNNIADNGAAELFADGAFTLITLPTTNTLSNMTLLGTAGKASGFYEDYVSNDTNYHWGTGKGAKAGRYPSISSPLLAASVNEANLYVCLTIGYARTIVVKVDGLHKDENAVFTITKTGESTPYTSFALTGTSDAGTTVTRTLNNMEVGSWTVQETGWGWSYNTDDPADRTVTKTVSESDTSVEFPFVFTKDNKLNGSDTKTTNAFESNSFRVTLIITPRTAVDSEVIGL